MREYGATSTVLERFDKRIHGQINEAPKEGSTSSPETSKRLLGARGTDAPLEEEIRSIAKRERHEIGEALDRVVAGRGRPHIHSGAAA